MIDTIPDATELKLGRLAPRYDERTLKLTRYLAPAGLPTPPPEIHYADSVAFQMFANSTIGDCTCAAAANAELYWAARRGGPAPVIADSDVIAAYSAITGYDPTTGANDNGAVELNVLNFWRTTGVAGHKIGAFAAVNLSDDDLTRAACWTFEGLYVGLALPATAKAQMQAGTMWDYLPGTGSQAAPGSWGGHAVYLCEYNSIGPVYATWGMLKQATWEWHRRYCEEQYAIISADYLRQPSGLTAEGLNTMQLNADLAAVST